VAAAGHPLGYAALWLRLLLSASGLAAAPFVGERRGLFLTLLGLAWVPWTVGLLVVAGWPGSRYAPIVAMTSDIVVVAMFQAALPSVRHPILFAWMLVVTYHAYAGGLLAGAAMAAVAVVATAVTRQLAPVGERIDALTFTGFVAAAASLAFLLDFSAREQRLVHKRLVMLHDRSEAILSRTGDAVNSAGKAFPDFP